MLSALFKPISIAPLVYFRVLGFGFITISVVQKWTGPIWDLLTEPSFHFSYAFAPWVAPWPEPFLHAHFAITVLAGVCAVLGLFYRVSVAVLFVGHTLIFLMDRSMFVNHTYLYCLLCFLSIFLPAHRAFSLDVWRKPSLRQIAVPAWTRYVFLFQMSIVYIFGGIAKFDADWLQARPMRTWLPGLAANQPLLTLVEDSGVFPYIISYGGLVFDLLVAPALLWRRTRPYAFVAACFFHLSNALIFEIGTFPSVALVLTGMFFSPETLRQLPLLNRLPPVQATDAAVKGAAAVYTPPVWQRQVVVASLLGVYAATQLLLPLRPQFADQPVSWTEDSHYFSWRMMLRSKAGHVRYVVSDPDGQPAPITVDPSNVLHYHQYQDMIGDPDMIVAFGHHLADVYQAQGFDDVQVHAEARAGLNGRAWQTYIDPDVNLADTPRDQAHDLVVALDD